MQKIATVDMVLPDGRAELITVRESACSGDCHKCAGCGAVKQTLRLTAQNPIDAQKGDIVVVQSETAVVLRGAALLYLLPVILFLVGYLSFMWLGAWAAATGGGGFVLGLLPSIFYNLYVKRHPPEYEIVEFVK